MNEAILKHTDKWGAISSGFFQKSAAECMERAIYLQLVPPSTRKIIPTPNTKRKLNRSKRVIESTPSSSSAALNSHGTILTINNQNNSNINNQSNSNQNNKHQSNNLQQSISMRKVLIPSKLRQSIASNSITVNVAGSCNKRKLIPLPKRASENRIQTNDDNQSSTPIKYQTTQPPPPTHISNGCIQTSSICHPFPNNHPHLQKESDKESNTLSSSGGRIMNGRNKSSHRRRYSQSKIHLKLVLIYRMKKCFRRFN